MVSWVKGALQAPFILDTTRSKAFCYSGTGDTATLSRVMDSVFQIKSASREKKRKEKEELHPQFFSFFFTLSHPESGPGEKKEREKGFWQKP